MTEPLPVSVALCTHNGARFVAAQIASILQQSRPVDEIVLSDDASSDDTVGIVERAVDEHRVEHGVSPELIVFRNDPPLRVTKNFEQALLATTGDLVALCDQDDVWHPQRIELLSQKFEDPSVDFVFGNAIQVDAMGQSLGHDLFEALGLSVQERKLVESGQAYRQFMRRNLATGATAMLRRSLVDAAAPFPGEWLHDEWLAVIAAARGGVRIYDEPLTDYRQHESNQVGMERLGLRRKFAMFAQPRTERNLRLYQRAQALAERIDGITGIPDHYRIAAREKFSFEAARQAYPEARVLRVVPILRQLLRGRYRSFGTGMKDAVRNLLQPV